MTAAMNRLTGPKEIPATAIIAAGIFVDRRAESSPLPGWL